jgi:membrane protein DedA with SNARE-associated domain
MHWFLAIAFERIEQWIAAGGYVVLFALLFLCGVGLPLPEDIPLMIAGALIANGKFHLATAAVVAWCGIIGGDMVLYHLGKKFGLEITRLPFVGKHLTKARIERVEQLFTKYGIWVVAIGRMFAGIRGAMVVAAGAIRYNRVKFIIADGLAAIVSGGLFLWIGHWLGNRLKANIGHIDKLKHDIFIGVVIIVLIIIAWIFWKRRGAKVALKVIDPATTVQPKSDAPPPPPAPPASTVTSTSDQKSD